jgi:hypothetical protein
VKSLTVVKYWYIFNLYIEKPSVLLSLSNMKEQRKKRKIMQTLGKENKNYIFQSHYRHDTEKKELGEDRTWATCPISKHTTN